MKNILVIGSLNADMVIYTDKMPQIGETINGRKFAVNAGGKGANQAAAVAKLGGNVKMLGCVGRDIYGDMLVNHCQSFGVQTDGIVATDCASGVAVITVCDGDNCIILDSGANARLSPAVIDNSLDLLKWADFVMLQFEIPMETVVYAAKKAKELNKTVIINPAPMCEFPSELLSSTDLFTPNRIECETLLNRKLTSDSDLEAAVRELQSKGIANVIITLGSNGCIYNDKDKIYRRGIVKSAVADTTAAGDSFIGGITVSLARGSNIHDAVNFATYTSSITVSREGAAKSIPTYDEVIEAINRP